MGVTRRRFIELASLSPFAGAISALPAKAQEKIFRHASTLFETVKYPPDFKHFDYINADAPKGGRVRLGLLGSFDSLNPWTIKGDPIDPTVNETLLKSSLDEPSSEYGLLAESFWHPDDFSSVVFRLRPEAKFHDGMPVTPEDVIFSLEVQKANLPARSAYYKDIAKVEKTAEREVTFTFAIKGNRELPHITGQLAILPKHWWTAKDANGKPRDTNAASLEPPLGSGPYAVSKIVSGSSFLLTRVPEYWGKDLSVNAGQDNFDEIEYQLYKDQTVLLEAFKGDQFDIQVESSSKNWATAYEFPATKDGRCIKEELPRAGVSGMQAWVLNLRRSKFSDARVRRAMDLAFDFEWSNTNLFYGQYRRARSFFNNSELEATGLPSPEELALLEPLKDKIPPEVFTAEYANPVSATAIERRKNLQLAQQLLSEAGWNGATEGSKQVLKNAAGEILSVEFTLYSPAFERIALPYKEQLEFLGFTVNIRLVDLSQYEKITEDFDYDIIVGSYGQSLSPGNEQRDFWSTEYADKKGSKNAAGIKDAAIDALVEKLIVAPDRKSLIAACKALDRVLMWKHFMIPQWFVPIDRIAYWKRVKHPAVMPGYSLGHPKTWWFDAKAAEELKKT